MISATSRRVPLHTCEDVNRQILERTKQRVAQYKHYSRDEIDQRLEELDQEWDTERLLEANAATLSFVGCVLAATRDRRWVFVPMVVTGFLFQHAVQGWCPPLPVIRRLGFRTMREIDDERIALKIIRGDFDQFASRDIQKMETDTILLSVER
ncbi:MAG TPA: hypothetical protein DDZ51_03130 [Planctomycetaceae bacterium]|nr:hypothetical protein [Planctomycetaceae bacterium]